MGGFLGLGGSSASTDRGNQLAATQGEWSLFDYGLGTGQNQQAAGTNTLNSSLKTLQPSADYYKSLLTAGRTDTAFNSAPAINATLAQSDTQRRQSAAAGTSRTGGTAAANRESGEATSSKVDDIINSTLLQGREVGAKGLQQVAGQEAAVGSDQLSNALNLLGLSQTSVTDILNNATSSRAESYKINQDQLGQYGAALGQIVTGFLG